MVTKRKGMEARHKIDALPIKTRRRMPQIIKGLLEGKTHATIGEICGVRRETISRDLKKWREAGGFDTWVEDEFFRLHGYVKNEPISAETAYRVIAKMKEKTITNKISARYEAMGDVMYRVVLVDDEDELGEKNESN